MREASPTDTNIAQGESASVESTDRQENVFGTTGRATGRNGRYGSVWRGETTFVEEHRQLLVNGCRPIRYRQAGDCWECISHALINGYPSIIFNGRHTRIHRVVACEVMGLSVDGLFVLHSCDNPRCVNPKHLRVGTHADNMVDRNVRCRVAKGKRNGKTKLTKEDVLYIRRSCERYKDLAVRFGTTENYIGKIRRKVVWKWV